MANNAYLVFSEKPAHIADDDYHSWYVGHAQENIESPGFVSAQRYRVREVAGGELTGSEQHLSLYEYEGDMATWRASLDARIAGGDIQLPDWFGQIKFRSWTCEPAGGLLVPNR